MLKNNKDPIGRGGLAAQSSNVLGYRLPGYGTFSTNLQIQYWYGLPRNVTFSSLSMDIDHMKQLRISKTNIKQESIAFTQNIGARMSAMEHLVPEQMFSTEAEKAQGISAVKALAIASQQGQKIWTIDENNVSLALGRINLGAEAENDIRNAVNAGKIATAHETRINFNGWIGESYTLIDPNTGAGGYMISGGGNGGELPDDNIGGVSALLTIFSVIAKLFKLTDSGRLFTVFAFILKINEVASKCSEQDAFDLILGLTALTILSIFLSWAIISFFALGVFLGIFLYFLMSAITRAILDWGMSGREGCEK